MDGSLLERIDAVRRDPERLLDSARLDRERRSPASFERFPSSCDSISLRLLAEVKCPPDSGECPRERAEARRPPITDTHSADRREHSVPNCPQPRDPPPNQVRRRVRRTAGGTDPPCGPARRGAILLSGGALLHWLSRLTFWRDEWGILLHRRGWSVGTFLDPAVEHLVAIPILIYKLLLGISGMDSPAPFQVVAVITFLVSVVLLFVYVRARLGAWLALAAILPILFLGPAWDDLLFPYQMTWFGSVRAGSRPCSVSIGRTATGTSPQPRCSSPGFSSRTRGSRSSPERRSRSPSARDDGSAPSCRWFRPLSGLWYLGWGHTAHTFVSFDNAAKLPSYVLDGLSSSISAYLGLSRPFGVTETPLSPGGAPSSCWSPAWPSGASTGSAGHRTGSG